MPERPHGSTYQVGAPWSRDSYDPINGDGSQRGAMPTVADLESVAEPLELFRRATEAMAWHQTQIDQLAEIRARAAAALYFQGTSYKELAETLGLSAPRIGQLIKSNNQDAMEVLKAFVPFEHRMTDVAGLSVDRRPGSVLPRAIKILASSGRVDPRVLRDIDDVRRTRNMIVHGAFNITVEEAEMSLDKLISLTATVTLLLHEHARQRREAEEPPADMGPGGEA